jgi:hypothetical protein
MIAKSIKTLLDYSVVEMVANSSIGMGPRYFSRYSDRLLVRYSRVDCRQGQKIFLFPTAYRSALGPTQHPIQWVPWALPQGVKRPGRLPDYSPPASAEDRNGDATNVPPLPHTPHRILL